VDKLILGVLLAVPLAQGAHAQCSAQSAARTPHLVELYTSEGCSSCPPADAWLRTLPKTGAVVALAFHVDYWDSLGWRDRFAERRYSERQESQARRELGASVYTPQVVLDGHSWRDWYRDRNMPAIGGGRMALQFAAERDAGTLQLHINAKADPNELDAYRGYVALTEDDLETDVRAGENRGVRLHHDHVVRNFIGPLPLAAAAARMDIPADVDETKSTLVAFAQNPRTGEIAQVVTLPLAQCR
jgi:hypothetical protein